MSFPKETRSELLLALPPSREMRQDLDGVRGSSAWEPALEFAREGYRDESRLSGGVLGGS